MAQTTDLSTWVNSAPDIDEKYLRQVIHICLHAIASNTDLRNNMYIKGGILLAVKYHSDRYTKDIDFSTPKKAVQEDIGPLLEKLSDSLIDAEEMLPYSISTCINSRKLKPAHKPNPTSPTLEIKIGYAVTGTPNHRHMIKTGKSTNTISIDYSFNEYIELIDTIQIEDQFNIFAYSLTDLIAEKYRAVLQQSVRNRHRRQDIYDLWMILCDPSLHNSIKELESKTLILKTLLIKSETRGISPTPASLNEDDIYNRSHKNYDNLKDEISRELPDFDEAFTIIKSFYESLPWEK